MELQEISDETDIDVERLKQIARSGEVSPEERERFDGTKYNPDYLQAEEVYEYSYDEPPLAKQVADTISKSRWSIGVVDWYGTPGGLTHSVDLNFEDEPESTFYLDVSEQVYKNTGAWMSAFRILEDEVVRVWFRKSNEQPCEKL